MFVNCFAHGQQHQRLAAQVEFLPNCTLHAALGHRTRKTRRKAQRLLAAAQRNGAWANGGGPHDHCNPATPLLNSYTFGLKDRMLALPGAQSAPALRGEDLQSSPRQQQRPRGPVPPPRQQGPSVLKILYNRVLRQLSSLQLAIGELAVIALLSAVGTVIEQNKPLEYYMQVIMVRLLLKLLHLGHYTGCSCRPSQLCKAFHITPF